jgi:hypothetical protein
MRSLKLLNLEDLKVLAVGAAGLSSALVEIDIVLKLVISVLSLLYVGKKTYDLYVRNKE